jgi:Ca2+-binding RTX toxin-like protein
MSYRSYFNDPIIGGYSNETFGFPQTYMANDILALQTLYGADYATHSENTVYTWSPTTGQEFINGVAQSAPGGNRIFATIWDGNGVDTYDLSNYTAAVYLDLAPGRYSRFYAQNAYLGDGYYASGTIYNAYLFNNDARSYVENAIGGSGYDTIIGNAIANSLSSGAGDDTITGGGGDDTIDGGIGSDTAVYFGNRKDYLITNNGTYFTIVDQRSGTPDGTDIVSNVENFKFADMTLTAAFLLPLNLVGGAGNAAMTGGPLDDYLDGRGGAHVMTGGKGDDTYVVDGSGATVVENNSSAFVAPSGWTVKGTSDFNHDGTLDVIVTNGTVNQFWLLSGTGVVQQTVGALSWGSAWPLLGLVDYNHDGNADLLFQFGSNTSVQAVDYLNGMTWTGGYAHPAGQAPDAIQAMASNEGNDTIIAYASYTLPAGVENLILATGAGNINGTGNALDNNITGNEGDNILTGGAGIDTFVFAPNFGKDEIKDFQVGDTIQFDHTLFIDVNDIIAHTTNDGSGNAVVTLDASNAVTIDNMTVALLQQRNDAFHLV